MQKKIGLLHCVYSPLWVYIFVITVYFACNIRYEKYSGDYITNTSLGKALQFKSSTSLSIIAASIISTTLGTVTMVDLIMNPPDSHVLNRHLLSATLFIPVACLVVYGCNLETFFPFTVIMVHCLQFSISTTCVCDFMRNVCPSTFSDLLSGAICLVFLFGGILLQVGFGSESLCLSLFFISSGVFSAVLILYSVYRFLKDEVALSFLSRQSPEKTIFFIVVGSYLILLLVSFICAITNGSSDITKTGKVETLIVYWTGVLFAISVLFSTNFFDGRKRIAIEKINLIKLAADEAANKSK